MHDSLTSTASAGRAIAINADNDSTGTSGTLTVVSSQTVTSNDNLIRGQRDVHIEGDRNVDQTRPVRILSSMVLWLGRRLVSIHHRDMHIDLPNIGAD